MKMFLVYYNTSISSYYEYVFVPIFTHTGIYIDPFIIFLKAISD